MKRLFIVLSLLLAGTVFALPGAVGLIAERQHDQIVEQVNAHGDQLSEDSYDRGWFSTRTRYRYRIDDKNFRQLARRITGEPDGISELLVDTEIHHGPLPVLSGGLDTAIVAWTDMDSTLSLRSASGVETSLPGKLSSRIEADGSSRFRYRADAESRTLDDGLALSWDDTAIDVVLGRNQDTLSVAGDIGRLKLSDTDAALEIGPAVIAATQQRTGSGLWTGDSAIRIDGLSLPGFATDDLVLETRVRESSGQATYAIELKADNLQGEGLAGDNAHIDVFAQRLDAQAMGDLLLLLNEFGDPNRIPAAQRDALLKRLLDAGPEVALRTLKIPTGSADIEGEALVSVNPGTGITPGELLSGAQGNATLLVPAELVEQVKTNADAQTRGVIDLMMRLRILKREGNRYRIEAAYANSLLTVNGFPVPVPNFR